MTDKPTQKEIDDHVYEIRQAGQDDTYSLASAVLAKWGQPAQAAGNVPAISDLPPLPDPDLRDVGTKPQDVKDFLNGYATEYARLALAARAPADSVLEDAMRYRWLREGNDAKHGAAWHVAVNLYGCEWDAAIDAAMNKGATP